METTAQNLCQTEYRKVNLCPEGCKYPTLANFAINALAIADQSTWNEIFRCLMEQVHQLYLMPDDFKCVLAMFAAKGFIRQPGIKGWVTVSDVVDHMNANCKDGQVAIVKASGSRQFIAILPDHLNKYGDNFTDGKTYHPFGLIPAGKLGISDVWVRWADGQDHSPVKRRKGRTATNSAEVTHPQDHEAFHYLQKNPKMRTGDCVIRGLASVLDIDWDEAMDRLIAISGGMETLVNCVPVYTKLLKQEGFVRRKPMRIDGRPVSGKVFCRELDKVFRNGEKVMAYIGSSHAAAILPVTENGATHYKIIDSWDSSGRTVGEYWVKIPERETVDAPKETRRVFGTYVTHPVFGRGKIRNIDPSGWMLVDFPQSGSRYLDCRWVLRNCKTEESASA